jgi:hypothetical protein
MANTISKKYIVDYITENYGEMKHNADKMIKSLRKTANVFKLNKKDLFHYIIERKNTIPMATSYGFDTAYGRDIRNTFSHYYYQ